MIDAIVAWDAEDDSNGNVQHIIEHGITMEEVEVLLNENNPVGEESVFGKAANLWKDFDWEAHYRRMGTSLGQPLGHSPDHCLRNR